MKSQTDLRYPFRSHTRMMVYPKSGIERQPRTDVLTQVHVSSQFIFLLIHQVGRRTRIFSTHILIPRMPSVAEPVEAKGNTVSLEESGTLIERNTHHVVT